MSPQSQRYRLAVRSPAYNDDHHLWNNHGTWWCHFTLHCGNGMKHRVRRSLQTKEVVNARKRRDALLGRLARLQNRATERRGA